MINTKRMLDEFLELVRIDSESKDERAMGERLVKILRGMGLEAETDDAGEMCGSNGFNVFARVPGVGEPVVMSAHMDTVTPGRGVVPRIEGGVVRSDGTTILGGDDKAGISAILEAVRLAREDGAPHRAAELIFSIYEEGGLHGAKAFDVSRLRGRQIFVFDSNGEPGSVVVAAPGQVKIRASVIGRSSHAGMSPEQGISAIQVAARAITEMKLLRVDDETTSNIGSFVSQFATNIVPERADIEAEARSRDSAKLEAQTAHMIDALERACADAGARLESSVETIYTAFKFSDDSPIVRRVLDAAERAGCRPSTALGGGGSDANIYNARGIDSVVLGIGMEDPHTTSEHIAVVDIEKTAKIALELLRP